jgi:dTDP-4-dehydrorhamnose reductase
VAEAFPTAPTVDRSVLVVGGDGMIGRRLAAALELRGRSVWRTTRRRASVGARTFLVDLDQDPHLVSLPKDPIEAAVLCAANTSMERCRLDPRETWRANVDNTLALATRLMKAGIFTVFLSSNTVFDGTVPFEKAMSPTSPRSEYGRQKAEVERQLLSLGDLGAVVRFSKVIPPDSPLLTGWIRDLRAREDVHPLSDVVFAPVPVGFAVELLVRIVERRLSGITQASASQDMTYEASARYLAGIVGAGARQVQPRRHSPTAMPFVPHHTTLDSARVAEVDLEVPPPALALDQLDWG